MAHDNLLTVELPSESRLYDNSEIPREIVIRSMKVADEKCIYGSNGEAAFQKILRRCIVEPKAINLDKLIPADEYYLLMQLRIHTFGSSYNISSRCPECGAVDERAINLDNLLVRKLPEEFAEPIEIELPSSGDKIGLRLLRNEDNNTITERAKKLSRQTGASEDEVFYVLRYAKLIDTVNGEQMDLTANTVYVENMSSVDSAYIDECLEDIKVGYDLEISHKCTSCGEDYDFGLPMSREFFKPKRNHR